MGNILPECIEESSKALQIVKHPSRSLPREPRDSAKIQETDAKSPLKIQFFYIHPLITDEIIVYEQLDEESYQAKVIQIPVVQDKPTKMNSTNGRAESSQIERITVDWNSFIKVKKKNYLEDYVFIKEIGRGAYGAISKVRMKYGGLFRAAKIIKSSAIIKQKENEKKLFAEVAIPMKLDHPNINKLFEVFEWKQQFVLVNELCEGGDLFQMIKSHKSFSEKKVAGLMKQIMSGLVYMHRQKIMHRDLKPENVLYDTESKLLKIIDFGTAIEIAPNDKHHMLVGTPYYIAPEVIQGEYDEKCDVWSCGIILYILLSGSPPFAGKSEKEIMNKIISKEVEFTSSIWKKRSTQCKNIVLSMLCKIPKNRVTAYQVLNSSWINHAPDHEVLEFGSDIVDNLKKFHFQNRLKAVVYTYIASQLYSNKDKEHMLKAFKEFDKDGDGVIAHDELVGIFNQFSSSKLTEQEVANVISLIDTNGSGLIDFTEFLVAASNQEELLEKKRLENAFSYLDADHSGFISIDEIKTFLDGSDQTADQIKKLFDEVDQNGDGVISKAEFMQLLLKKD